MKRFLEKYIIEDLDQKIILLTGPRQVLGDNGAKLENLIACALLKEIHYLANCYGTELDLCYIRTKYGREIDFLITQHGTPLCMIEAKWADSRPSDNFRALEGFFPGIKKIQLVKELDREKTCPKGLEIRSAQKLACKLFLGERCGVRDWLARATR